MEKFTLLGKIILFIIFIIALCFCFYGATFYDHYIGMAYYIFPMIIGFLISINFLFVSIKNKKIHPLIFCYVFLFISQIMGKYYLKYRENKLIETGNKIDNYFENKDNENFNSEIIKDKLDNNILIIYKDDYYILKYKNEDRFYYHSKEKKIQSKVIP
jgi:Ca2+/Na+ antiporter